MARNLKPHGTYAAFMRHKRAGEEPCPACREASRKNAAVYRERKRAEDEKKTRRNVKKEQEARLTVEPVKHTGGETVRVRQTVAYGQSIEVEVPALSEPSEIYDELLLRARASLQVAVARDVPGLISAAVNVVTEKAKLADGQPANSRPSLVDELARVRAAREARAAAGGA
jgi:hypothetical protein|nr:MAG TPA: hypothetical protein [Caudoviricetes sp.]